jgi:hypothetical protein
MDLQMSDDDLGFYYPIREIVCIWNMSHEKRNQDVIRLQMFSSTQRATTQPSVNKPWPDLRPQLNSKHGELSTALVLGVCSKDGDRLHTPSIHHSLGCKDGPGPVTGLPSLHGWTPKQLSLCQLSALLLDITTTITDCMCNIRGRPVRWWCSSCGLDRLLRDCPSIMADLEASRCILMEYDSEGSEILIGSIMKLPAMPWRGWIGVINEIKLKDLILFGAAAWIIHECFFRKQRQRISGNIHSCSQLFFVVIEGIRSKHCNRFSQCQLNPPALTTLLHIGINSFSRPLTPF